MSIDSVRAGLYRRRGGWFPGPARGPEPDLALLRDRAEEARPALTDPGTHEELRAVGLAALADPGSATPWQTAVLLAALLSAPEWDRPADEQVAAVVAGTAARGVPFLAETTVLLAGINAGISAGLDAGAERRIADPHGQWRRTAPEGIVRFAAEVRDRLAGATDADYAAAETAAARHRDDGPPMLRLITSLLFPARQDWVEQDVADVERMPYRRVLFYSVGTPAALERLADAAGLDVTALPTLVEGVGAGALPTLLAWYDKERADQQQWMFYDATRGAEVRGRLAEAIALLPSDAALEALLARAGDPVVVPALRDAAVGFPDRALRLLTPTASWMAADLLRIVAARHPQPATAALPALPPAAADVVRAMLAPEAPADRLHPVLVDPPWHGRRAATTPSVIKGLSTAVPAEARWRPGERERFAETARRATTLDPEELAARVRAGRIGHGEDLDLLMTGPPHLALPVLADWDPHWWRPEDWLPPIVARWGEAAIPAALRVTRGYAPAVPVLMPLVSAEIATLMAGWFTRTKSLRGTARAWLLRHPDAAALALVPAAVGEPGPARREAETALRLLDRDVVRAAADGYGPKAVAAIESLLDTDPLTVLPARIPSVTWADPETLPRIRLREGDSDGGGVLPAVSARHLVTMLAISTPADAYPGLPIAAGLLDPGDLAEFGWALFRRWQADGVPPGKNWALTALGHVGDDETVRRLAPVIRAWPGEGGHSRAVTGLDVLATIGSDVALMHLHGIAQKVKYKGLRDRAGTKLAEVADAKGLTPQQLADRLVPSLGLAADGSLRLDRFTVGFDELLRPYVTDEAGKRRKTLPKGEAATRFAALRKDVRVLAADQLRRLEQAMVDGRRWSGEEFRLFLAGHPLLGHLVRRLVWGVAADDRVTTFRVAEDRSYATAAEETLTVADDAVIVLPHPAGTPLDAWSEVFADYEIIQPFPQLGREVFRPSEADWDACDGVVVPTGRVLGLERRGWRREDPMDGGVQTGLDRPAGDRWTAHLLCDPGFVIGDPAQDEEQKLCGVWLSARPGETPVPFDRIDPVTASELFRDLRELIA
ncbi:DUF4132 domain-containing protein [Catenuloplanes japonicus]|uniref:DUF4132 domain-containing protein n=1 Tax=Catenuloplanes japonicus TaxID=33876 RepID=UPI00068F1F26|nr:DUF4132 domain-containing protein [Catenuloplanes japonicus]